MLRVRDLGRNSAPRVPEGESLGRASIFLLPPASAERSWRAPVILADEQLEYWGEFYLSHPEIRRRGISFEQFLCAAPKLRALPRLLVQLAVRARLDRVAADVKRLSPRHREAIARPEATR